MSYKFEMPKDNSDKVVYELESNAVIIVGANGSGKSRMGIKIEKDDPLNVHRIVAQKSLVFERYIPQKSYEHATNLILFGNQNKRNNNDERYPFDGEKRNYVSYAVNDFNNVLAALFALHNKEQGAFIKECKELEKNGENHNNVPEMSIDKLIKIWNYIFPHRDIYFEDGRVICLYKKDDITRDYEGREMSDGERAALYLISQAICVPGDKKVIIIDEPELHLHHSIMNKILAAIEHERKDILFIYITHDLHYVTLIF